MSNFILDENQKKLNLPQFNLTVGLNIIINYTDHFVHDNLIYRQRWLSKKSSTFDQEYANRLTDERLIQTLGGYLDQGSVKEWEIVDERDSPSDPNFLTLTYKLKIQRVIGQNLIKRHFAIPNDYDWISEFKRIEIRSQRNEINQFSNGYSNISSYKESLIKKINSIQIEAIAFPLNYELPIPQKRFEAEVSYSLNGESFSQISEGFLVNNYFSRTTFFSFESKDEIDKLDQIYRSFQMKAQIFN